MVCYNLYNKGGSMYTVDNIKNNIKELTKKYYEIENQLKKIDNYDLGDNSQNDKDSTNLVLLWINIRNEIFYNRVKLVEIYMK